MSLRLERLLAMAAADRGGRYPSVAVFMRRFEAPLRPYSMVARRRLARRNHNAGR